MQKRVRCGNIFGNKIVICCKIQHPFREKMLKSEVFRENILHKICATNWAKCLQIYLQIYCKYTREGTQKSVFF